MLLAKLGRQAAAEALFDAGANPIALVPAVGTRDAVSILELFGGKAGETCLIA